MRVEKTCLNANGRIERSDNAKEVALHIEKIDEIIERKRRLFGAEAE